MKPRRSLTLDPYRLRTAMRRGRCWSNAVSVPPIAFRAAGATIALGGVPAVKWQRGSGFGPGWSGWRLRSGPSTAGSWQSMLGSRRAATTGTPDLAPGDPGAIDSHDRHHHHHHHARVGQDRRPGQPGTTSRAEWGRGGSGHATAAPDGSSWRRPRYCLESITNAPPGPIIRWSIIGSAPRKRQVVQDHPPSPLQLAEKSGGAPPPAPAAKRRRAGWAGTAVPGRPRWPPARRGPVPSGAPAGCRRRRRQHPLRG
jgi:hypothetical protein